MESNWRKSVYSGDQGNCVEVADRRSGVLVRDTRDRTGPALAFTADVWRAFAHEVKAQRLASIWPIL